MVILLLRFRSRFNNGVPPHLVTTIVEQMKPYISTNDIALLSHALSVLALLLQVAPEQTYPAVETEYLKDIYNIAHSPLLSGASLDALLLFFARLVEADDEIATHVIPSLTIPLQKQKKGDASYSNIAKCIGIIVRCHPSLAAGTIAEFSRALKVTLYIYFRSYESLTMTVIKLEGIQGNEHPDRA